MSGAATKNDIQHLEQQMDKAIEDLANVITNFAQQIDERFNKIEAGLEGVKVEVGGFKESHNRLLNTIDGFIARIDRYETELAARDSQFERLLSWARKVSKKTGIPLENL